MKTIYVFCVRIASLETFPSRTPHALFKLMHLYEILCSLHWRFPELRLHIWGGQCTRLGHAFGARGARGSRAGRVQGSVRELHASGMLWRCVLTNVMYGMRTGRVRHAGGGIRAHVAGTEQFGRARGGRVGRV